MRTVRWWVGGVLLLAAGSARAGGFEQPDNGTRASGRAGAFTARADDLTALQYNVAGLAGLRGTQAAVDLMGIHQSLCFQREGTYGPRLMDEPFPETCNTVPVDLLPFVAISSDFGLTGGPVLAFGIWAPSSPQRVAFAETVPTPNYASAEGPQRYDLVSRDVIVLSPTLAAAYDFGRGLRVGLALHSTIALLNFVNYANAGPTYCPTFAEDPGCDVRVDLRTADYFVPGATASVQYRPLSRLEMGVTVRWMEAIYGGGTAHLTSGANSTDAVATVRSSFPLVLRAGVRYRHPRRDATFLDDPMTAERFDIELDATYETNSNFRSLDLTLDGNEPAGGTRLMPPLSEPRIAHNWTDTFSVRLGSDVVIQPGKLAVRAGVSYESSGVPVEWTRVDFASWERIGLHMGATLRLGAVDLSVTYMHLFQTPRTVGAEGQVTASVLTGTPPIVNRGRYTGSFDTIGLSANFRL